MERCFIQRVINLLGRISNKHELQILEGTVGQFFCYYKKVE
jgi:hypothetical protein